ncbi:Type II secretion system protein [Candidatus Sulfobium mesophilum]|uniref:Type II secretion system protein n=1 Tax=Candidatus Sulfobium mesophilum TaxID=2016548 RepID=A0A2U3QGG9_9BACT|nr:Type II secretion system protein [Candidatus Sulfobium mesophilum]
MEIIIAVGIFVTLVLLIEGGYVFFFAMRNSESRTIRRRLRTLSAGSARSDGVDILRKKIFSEIPWLNRVLIKITMVHGMNRLLEQANSRMPVSFYFFLSILFASAGYATGVGMRIHSPVIIVMAILSGIAPFLYLYFKKQKRMQKFLEHLPEALELIARALKAGHSFSGGLKMAAEEFGDPIGTEFDKTLSEINFGVGIADALKNFANRVDCPDLQFFVVSVLIQRETGGNLAEILEKIAYLIRERFKLHGRVRALAAEGKLSAIVLILLPPLMALYFLLIRPEYIGLLFEDRIGITMVIGATIMMTIGVLTMKKMVTIKV